MQLDEYWFEFLVFSKFKLKYFFLSIKKQLAISINGLKLYFYLRKQLFSHGIYTSMIFFVKNFC